MVASIGQLTSDLSTVPPIFPPEEGEKIGSPTPAARRSAGGPFLTRTKLGHPRGDLFNSFARRLT